MCSKDHLKDRPRSRNGVHVVIDISMSGLAIDKRSSHPYSTYLVAMCNQAEKLFSSFVECDMSCLFITFPARSGARVSKNGAQFPPFVRKSIMCHGAECGAVKIQPGREIYK